MHIEHIVVVKETREGEGRVALTPSAAGSLVSQGHYVLVEDKAGILSEIDNEEYIKAGAHIFKLDTDGVPSKSLILRVKRPTRSREQLENKFLKSNTVMIGFLDPFDVDRENHIANWRNLGIIP